MGSRSALVIDDSKSARFALRRYLENHSYVVDTAESAESAFNYLKDHHPEVIFLDHVMPGVDGFDVLNSIKNDPRTIDIPVVICSSNEGDAFTQEARFKGAADVLPKPPTPHQLARVLGSLDRITTGARVPGGVSPAVSRPLYVPPAANGQTHVPAKPREDAVLDKLTALLDQMRTQLVKATEDLAAQLSELKTQVSRLESRRGDASATRGAFGKLRERLLGPGTGSRPSRLSVRRKLPRR
jgi:CheY-like chemotaxis protein